jgi:hypothetical protein
MSRSKGMMVVSLVAGVLATGLGSADASAHGRASRFAGGLTTEQVECDTFCTEGPLTGGLAGTLEWRMDSMTETNNPDVVTFIGVNTITTPSGTLTGTDYGIWNIATGEFVDFTVWESGTGVFSGAHGHLLIVGGFDAASGTGSSRYTSVVR